MRMPFIDFLTQGDLKFVLILYAFLIMAIVFFFKKLKQKEQQEIYNIKIKKLVSWTLVISTFSLLLGLLHSFYFMSKVNGVAPNLFYGGLANVLVTPTLGVAIAIIIKLLTCSLNKKSAI